MAGLMAWAPVIRFSFRPGTAEDAAPLAALHKAVADNLNRQYGPGPRSAQASEERDLYTIRPWEVFVARAGTEIVGTLLLATENPWS